jgi:hypothetical protein
MLIKLTQDHLDLFLELKKDNPGQWKMGKEYEKIVPPEHFFLNVMCGEYAYSVGWLEDNKLLSVGTLQEAYDWPAWHMLYLSTIKTKYQVFQETKLHLVMSELFQESFRRKLSSCINFTRDDFPLVTSNATGRMREKIHEYHTMIPEILMYDWVDEYDIPANTTPKYEFMNHLMAYQQWPFDLKIRRGYLKQEFRKEILFT